jgi:hypothetical protein
MLVGTSEVRVLLGLTSEARALAREAGRFVARQSAASVRRLVAVRLDALVAFGLGAVASAYALTVFYHLDFAVLAANFDTWFDGDSNRVIAADQARNSWGHYRTKVHPLFALFVSLPLLLLHHIGISNQNVAGLLIGGGALAFGCAFYTAARTLRLPRVDAALATILVLSTSSSMFWLVVPEVYTLGAVTLLISLIWLGASRGEHDLWSAPLQCLLSVSITVTNWMAGLLACVLSLGLRRTLDVAILTFALLSGFTVVQNTLFPTSGRLFDFTEDVNYIAMNRPGVLPQESFLEREATLLGQPFIAPTPALATNDDNIPGVNFTSSFPTRLGPVGILAVVGWVVLLVGGFAALWSSVHPLKTFILSLVGLQLALHSVYGYGGFLYSLHFTPFLVLIAAFSCTTRWRWLALTAMAVTAAASFAHNGAALHAAMDLLQTLPKEPVTPPPSH